MTGDWWTLAASRASQLRHTGTHLITIVIIIIIIIVSPSSLLSHHVSSSLSLPLLPTGSNKQQSTEIKREERESGKEGEREVSQ